MNILAICDSTLNPVWNILNILVNVIWIGVPILLIILGMIDLGKAVIASKDDEVKKAQKSLFRRLLYAVAVFAVVWIVTTVLNLVAGFGFNGPDETSNPDTTGWQACWKCIRNGKC